MAEIFYTLRERTEKKWSASKAIETALSYLKEKGIEKVCTNAVGSRRSTDLMTLPEFNALVERLIDDSYYYR